MLIRNIRIKSNTITDLPWNRLKFFYTTPEALISPGGGRFGEDCLIKPKVGVATYFHSISKDVQILDTWTVAYWVKADLFPMWCDVAGFIDTYGINFWVYQGNPIIYVQSGGDGGRVTVTLNTDTWYYLQYTYDSGIVSLYVNATLVSTLARPTTNTTTLSIFNLDNYYNFQGKISDFCMWDSKIAPIVPNYLRGVAANTLYIAENKEVYKAI